MAKRFDAAIRFFLYLLLFWLPYSNAVIQSAVIASFILWAVKRALICDWRGVRQLPWLGKVKAVARAFQPKPTFLNVPIFCFIGVAFIAAASSAFAAVALRGFVTKTLEWFIIYFLCVEVFTDKKHLRIALGIFLFSACATCVDAVLQFHVTGTSIFRSRHIVRGGATSGFAHPNGLGAYLTVVIPLALAYCFSRRGNKIVRLLLIGFFAIAAWAVVVTFSRGAWVGAGVGILFVLYALRRTYTLWFVALMLIAGFCAFAFSSGNARRVIRIDTENISQTAHWRLGLWADSITMIKERPLFGHGTNTFMRLFQGYRRKAGGKYDYDPTYAHNCYLQLAAETGLIGFGVFVWILARFFKKTVAVMRAGIRQRFDMAIVLAGITAGICGYLTHSFFDTNFYSLRLAALLWLLVGMAVSLTHSVESGA